MLRCVLTATVHRKRRPKHGSARAASRCMQADILPEEPLGILPRDAGGEGARRGGGPPSDAQRRQPTDRPGQPAQRPRAAFGQPCTHPPQTAALPACACACRISGKFPSLAGVFAAGEQPARQRQRRQRSAAAKWQPRQRLAPARACAQLLQQPRAVDRRRPRRCARPASRAPFQLHGCGHACAGDIPAYRVAGGLPLRSRAVSLTNSAQAAPGGASRGAEAAAQGRSQSVPGEAVRLWWVPPFLPVCHAACKQRCVADCQCGSCCGAGSSMRSRPHRRDPPWVEGFRLRCPAPQPCHGGERR